VHVQRRLAAALFVEPEFAANISGTIYLLTSFLLLVSRLSFGLQCLCWSAEVHILCGFRSSELETLRAVSKRTFSSGNRMAVHRVLGAIFNLVTRWETEDRLEEGLYRLLDSLKAPVPLRIGEAFTVVIYCTAPHVDKKSRSKWARALR
jgi:hypothetical protein